MTAFTPDLYAQLRDGCQRSAAAVVPLVHQLVAPRSVIDVGGGEGWWAREFVAAGTERVLVLDESVPVADANPDVRVRDAVEFAYFDATRRYRDALASEKFDLAVCLEVVEHVDVATGDYLTELLCEAAPVVLFSAAIPGQGGNGHINCQWPAYWAEKFEANGLYAHDCLRGEFWNDGRVEPWYRQNLLLFTKIAASTGYREIPSPDGLPLSLVHPDIWTGSGR